MAFGPGVKALAAGTLLCAIVAGCTTVSPWPDAAPSPTSSTSSTPARPATISLGVYGPEPMVKAYGELAAAFHRDHPEITVKVEPHADVDGVLSSVEGPDAPDVFLMDHDHLASLVQDKRLHPVDTLLEARNVDFGDGYQRGGLTAFAANASLQCMPLDVSPVVVYYNRDLVDLRRLAGPGEEPPGPLDGWTWEMFTAAARKAARGPADGVYIEPSLESIAPFVWSAGADIVDDTRTPSTLTLADGDTRAALEQLLRLVRDPRVTPTAHELAQEDAVKRFADGKLGMILGTRALTPTFRAATGLRFDVMPLPSLGRVRTVADVSGYCISARTEHLEAAADFITFAVGRKGAAITTRPGYIVPSNLEVANSAVFTQASRQPASSFLFNEGVRRAQTMPFSAAWPQLADQSRKPLHRMFYSPVIDLAALLDRIDRLSTRVLPQVKQ